MAEKEVVVQRRGMGFLGWLTLIFIVLKFNPGGHLDSPVQDWSWLWVLSPILIPLAILGFVMLVLAFVAVAGNTLDYIDRKKRRKAAEARRLARRNIN